MNNYYNNQINITNENTIEFLLHIVRLNNSKRK